jgi:hypothetical protein
MSKNIVPIKTTAEQNREQERLHEIFILLQQLFQREEATAKRIIECLYDIGTVNWINKNIRLFPFNSLFKYMMRFPKPLAKILTLKLYFQPKCPILITDWLYTLVEFKEKEAIPMEVADVDQESLPEIKKSYQEIKLLRQRVRLLTGCLLLTIAVFGGSFVWIINSLELTPSEILPFAQSKTIKSK